jgi:hypothetical protein
VCSILLLNVEQRKSAYRVVSLFQPSSSDGFGSNSLGKVAERPQHLPPASFTYLCFVVLRRRPGEFKVFGLIRIRHRGISIQAERIPDVRPRGCVRRAPLVLPHILWMVPAPRLPTCPCQWFATPRDGTLRWVILGCVILEFEWDGREGDVTVRGFRGSPRAPVLVNARQAPQMVRGLANAHGRELWRVGRRTPEQSLGLRTHHRLGGGVVLHPRHDHRRSQQDCAEGSHAKRGHRAPAVLLGGPMISLPESHPPGVSARSEHPHPTRGLSWHCRGPKV